MTCSRVISHRSGTERVRSTGWACKFKFCSFWKSPALLSGFSEIEEEGCRIAKSEACACKIGEVGIADNDCVAAGADGTVGTLDGVVASELEREGDMEIGERPEGDGTTVSFGLRGSWETGTHEGLEGNPIFVGDGMESSDAETLQSGNDLEESSQLDAHRN